MQAYLRVRGRRIAVQDACKALWSLSGQAPRPRMTVYGDLVRFRELFANLFRRDFQAKYKGSVLGILWSLLNPLALLGVYLLVFGLLWQGNEIPHYPLYLLAGLACWIFFSTSLQTA